MPIKRENYRLYPGGSPHSKEWKALRAVVLERAGHHCEGCGAPNYAPHPVTGSRVVLTIAHLNHNPTDNADANLRAWCQKCHLAHDHAHHQANAARTRAVRIALLGERGKDAPKV
jgi:5-methylcytosine-specific restriction endonuclease McrA